ncbi:hypothetical protein BDZ91DRAFT_718247 [Kalaharituber pfeilii]|nr:hypothetical protein BDZ91DRAFT_718247 [Kalaharituber pfeilii]
MYGHSFLGLGENFLGLGGSFMGLGEVLVVILLHLRSIISLSKIKRDFKQGIPSIMKLSLHKISSILFKLLLVLNLLLSFLGWVGLGCLICFNISLLPLYSGLTAARIHVARCYLDEVVSIVPSRVIGLEER